MNKTIKIFGYGSLININSVENTLSNTTWLTPAILKNHTRIFDTKSTHRFTKKHSSICVLDIKEKEGSIVNGVYFEILETDLPILMERENAYEMKPVNIETLSWKNSFPAMVFVDTQNIKQEFLFESEHQTDYLKICLEGARNFWKKYYDMFLETTFINDKNVKSIPELKNII
jgi:cation transport regulator ChaC